MFPLYEMQVVSILRYETAASCFTSSMLEGLQWEEVANLDVLYNAGLTLFRNMMNAFLIIPPMQKQRLRKWQM